MTGAIDLAGYRRDEPGTHPAYDTPEYKSTRLRAPDRPLIVVPHTLSEITGPVYGHERMGELDHDLTQPARGRAARRADHRHRPCARRRRPPGAQRAGRGLAVQRGRPLHPPGRSASRTAGPELLGRRALPDRRRRPLPVHHDQAGRLSVGQPRERLAARPHPLLAVRAGVRDPAGLADVLPGRPAVRVRPDLQLGPRPAGARADDRALRPVEHQARVGARRTSGTSCCEGARRRRWRTDARFDAVADRRSVLRVRAAVRGRRAGSSTRAIPTRCGSRARCSTAPATSSTTC